MVRVSMVRVLKTFHIRKALGIISCNCLIWEMVRVRVMELNDFHQSTELMLSRLWVKSRVMAWLIRSFLWNPPQRTQLLSVRRRHQLFASTKPNQLWGSVSCPLREHSTPWLKKTEVSMNLLDAYFPTSIAGSGARKEQLFSHTNNTSIPSVGTKVNSSCWRLNY